MTTSHFAHLDMSLFMQDFSNFYLQVELKVVLLTLKTELLLIVLSINSFTRVFVSWLLLLSVSLISFKAEACYCAATL